RLRAVIETLATSGPDAVDLAESEEYLRWLESNHFTFLGYQEYEVRDGALRPVAGTALGVLRVDAAAATSDCDDAWARAIADLPRPLVLTKASERSTVHRPSYLDYVGIKRVDTDGRLVGEHRFLGLYTTVAYWERAQQIPILREKVEHVLALAGFAPDSHDRKALLEILEEYPRDELLQIDPDELFDVAMGILAIGERQRIRLFVRRDRFERFVSCLVFLPRDRFNTANRQRIGTVLGEALGATVDEWGIVLSESVLVRIHYLFRTKPHGVAGDRVDEIEQRLVDVTRSWAEDLRDALVAASGEERGDALYQRYGDAFPVGYRDDWPARSAVEDIQRIEAVAAAGGGLAVAPYRPLDAHRGVLRCKLFSTDSELSLSDVLPMFENMGLRITDERPHELTRDGGRLGWIYDFGFTTERAPDFGAEGVSERFQEAFVGVWHGDYESDPLNRLVLDAALTGREVAMLRAIGRYLWQAAPALGESALHRSLTAHPGIAALLVSLFRTRFHPATADLEDAEHLAAEIEQAIDAVESLDEDRVLRGHLAVLRAMTRTDYFQRTALGEPKSSLAFKLDPRHVALVPEPRPHHEIFVHSPRLEGVHLRGGQIARGGLRWSDRRDDFRTEILGLMKAQTVKNAVIVPVGAKGGFVVRRPPVGDAAALRDEALACYRTLVASLLELTDNVVDGAVVPPADTVRYDGDDSYLVVAADKGTAALSDVANEISLAHGFWLGDAFASGGS
ncbi:MAG: NAD-glutamate dehydrogenase domain-containing protein, partial [Solirubrobacteraceae bacterium]